MWADGIVVTPPDFDKDLGFSQREEDLSIEELVAQPRIEALDVAVLPGRTRPASSTKDSTCPWK